MITIADNDVRTLSVTAAPTVIDEGGTSTLTITANPAPMSDLTIPFTINGSGIVPDDYTLTVGGTALTALTGNVTLPMNQTSLALTLTSVNDADTIAETLTLTLNAGTGYTVSSTARSAKVTINPIPLPILTVAATPAVINEGGTSTITITANSAPAGDLTIPYTISGSNITTGNYTLTTGGTALTGLRGNVTLPRNETSVALTLISMDDADTIAETMLTLTLNVGTGYTVSSTAGSATVTIRPFAQTVQFASSNVEVVENVGGGMVAVTVELRSPVIGDTTIPIMTADDTATAGTDYTTTTTNIVIADGATTGTAMIPILDDGTYEADEAFTVSFGTLPSGVSSRRPEQGQRAYSG